jgi:hypothetical protein
MRDSRLRTTLAFLVAAISAAPASAQFTSSAEVRTETSQHAELEKWRGASALGASLRLDRPHWSLSSTGSLTSDADRWQSSGELSALMIAPALGPLQLSASSVLSRTYRSGDIHNELSAHGRASLAFGTRGAWIGIDARQLDGPRALTGDPWPVLGTWQQLGRAMISLQFSPRRARLPGTLAAGSLLGADSIFNDTLGIWEPYDRGPSTDTVGSIIRSWSDAEARVVWARGRLALDATVGGRIASSELGNSMWGQLHGLYAISPRVVLIAATGTEPSDPTLGWERQSFATVGVRLLSAPEPRTHLPAEVRPAAADFRVEAVREQEYMIRVRVSHARTVELSADFIGWKPLALSRASDDWWHATVAIVPGTHHVNIRVNGDAWTAPPGMPAVEDEFNGTVGLLVVH